MSSFLKNRKEFDQKNINEPKGYIRAIRYKTLLIFLVIFTILASLVVLVEKISGENLKKEAIIYSTEQGLQIQRQLNQACSSVHAISAVLQLNTDYFANLKDFELFANNLLPS